MLTCTRLRIEPTDSASAVEYRIENGLLEYRSITPGDEACASSETDWFQLTPEQLGGRVLESPVLAYWLRRKLGLYGLIAACNPAAAQSRNGASDYRESNDAMLRTATAA